MAILKPVKTVKEGIWPASLRHLTTCSGPGLKVTRLSAEAAFEVVG
ncbi:hypothetical protein [Streptomyces mirabilis]